MPCFRGEKYIESSIREAEIEFSTFIKYFEIVLVVDGIVDRTIEIASRLTEEYENLKVYGYEINRGKGYAVRHGIEKAKGEYIFMLDSDMDYSPASLKEFLTIAEESKADIVIGNRRDPRSIFIYPLARKVSGYIFNRYVNAIFSDLDIPDTQASAKLLKTENIKSKLLPEIERYNEADGYIFDVCLLVFARKMGLKIVSSPCIFKMRSSTIGIGKSFLQASYKMWKQVLSFKLAIRKS